MPNTPTTSRRQASNVSTKATLARHGSHWAGEVIPDSEEERQRGVTFTEVIEISSDEEDTLYEANDPFESIPGAWSANNFIRNNPSGLDVRASVHDPRGRPLKATRKRTYRARRIIESSSSEESDAERKVHVDPEIIELSDSSPERPTAIHVTPKRLKNKQREIATQLIYSRQEDSSDDGGAILTLDEPKSARKPLHLPSLTQSPTKTPLVAFPGKRVRDLLHESEGSLTLDAHPTLVGTLTRQQLLVPPSTPKTGAKVKQTPLTGKKAQAAAEQARRELYAQELFDELNRVVFKDGLPKDTKLFWSKRLLTTAGKARWHRSRDGVQTTQIELAQKILDCDERIRNTLSHEMCHLACWIIDAEPKEGHGRFWKAWAARVMHKRPEIDITTRHDYEISHPFEWKCQQCAKIYGRFSKSIDPDKCVCGACKEGRLTPLFTTRAPRTPKTPKASRMASTRPQDSPLSIPRSTTSRTDSGSNDDSERVIHSIHDSDSESDPDIAMLTITMGSVTFMASDSL